VFVIFRIRFTKIGGQRDPQLYDGNFPGGPLIYIYIKIQFEYIGYCPATLQGGRGLRYQLHWYIIYLQNAV